MFERKRDGEIGTVDGGEGRGIRLGGSDRRPPTGYRNVESSDEEEVIVDDDPLADYEAFTDQVDAEPDDRRRDPLRR